MTEVVILSAVINHIYVNLTSVSVNSCDMIVVVYRPFYPCSGKVQRLSNQCLARQMTCEPRTSNAAGGVWSHGSQFAKRRKKNAERRGNLMQVVRLITDTSFLKSDVNIHFSQASSVVM